MASAKWEEFEIGSLFEFQTSAKRFDANKVNILTSGTKPYVVRTSQNNGVRGYLDEDDEYLNPGNTFSFGQDTATIFYQADPYFTGDKIKVLIPRFKGLTADNAQFFKISLTKAFSGFSWGSSRYTVSTLEVVPVLLPANNGELDFEFMEKFVAELEAQRLAELEAYLEAAGLKDYTLTPEEEEALQELNTTKWGEFNLLDLFGPSTRGKRLKSADRVDGTLPFVTAGEKDTGVSAHISNDVEVFEPHTVTIDMFGSAKYRPYEYGGDDHVAIVHTESIPPMAAIFIASACHKAAHTGEFNYGRNFYAKDADALWIKLPVKNEIPNYGYMETLVSAVQKLVIKDVVEYADRKISATHQVIS
ncbi:MAG: restriction endonuclease subunit S [Rothia sp. (in: high G+C Gram-positive bacteria)]|uniref:restriction endonuclease subunit S n=1 Tax=Rothia sp. (in: high G+C Gram-positive bacteria) TaxID=1885016 RepID=UPI0026E0FE72|nr:restriction endonuclease subunit S [Rothia sp. (in: high G+C Gram-positive bacteria)]MDO5750633.1 restriction endonuclease subunit S [Rothia sp. (in: high G+C Gram-positive bacteria)]